MNQSSEREPRTGEPCARLKPSWDRVRVRVRGRGRGRVRVRVRGRAERPDPRQPQGPGHRCLSWGRCRRDVPADEGRSAGRSKGWELVVVVSGSGEW